jgi:hexulose-6-phosphate isomerase
VIDWVIDGERVDENPLMTSEGLSEIKELEESTGVAVIAVCADYFKDFPLIRCTSKERDERVGMLHRILRQMSKAGISYLELPFVDQSAIKTDNELKTLVELFSSLLDEIHKKNVTLAFETSLPPDPFAGFLNALDHPAVKVNYDIGNSASLGYDPREELMAYGQYVATVHVKDRIYGGGSVPLGTGDTDFDACFSMLKRTGFRGPFILQAARDGEEMAWCRSNREFVLQYLRKYYLWT